MALTRDEAIQELAYYQNLERAFIRARYEPTDQTPESVAQWYAASHRLLALCQRLVDEGIEPEKGA